MKAKLASLNKNIEWIVANSNNYGLTNSKWLPSGILNAFWGLIISITNQTKIEIDKIGK